MDTSQLERLQAMKRYRKRRQFLPSLIQYLVAILLLGLLLSSTLCLPTIFSSLKLFYFAFLPNLHTIVFGPKCLFILCNLIVVFLVGESKLSKPSLAPDIYEEYMNRDTNLRRLSTSGSKKGSAFKKAFAEGGEEGEEEKGGGGWEVVEEGHEELDGEGKKGLDELKKRVEDFIARVNKQRRLEARMQLCYD